MKELRCAEIGLFPDCEWVGRAEDEDAVMAAAAEHAHAVHGMQDEDMTENAIALVKSHIHDA